MADLPRDEAQQGDRQPLGSGLAGVRVLELGAQEGSDVRPGLRDDKVVNIKELGNTGERAFAVGVAGVAPGAEGGFFGGGPGDDGAGLVFAAEDDGGVTG